MVVLSVVFTYIIVWARHRTYEIKSYAVLFFKAQKKFLFWNLDPFPVSQLLAVKLMHQQTGNRTPAYSLLYWWTGRIEATSTVWVIIECSICLFQLEGDTPQTDNRKSVFTDWIGLFCLNISLTKRANKEEID